MMHRAIIKVYGKVQNVFFRATIRQKASSLDLAGCVSNEKDGTVKIEAQGSKQNLQELIDFCYNGVESAQVDKVSVNWTDQLKQEKDFIIKY